VNLNGVANGIAIIEDHHQAGDEIPQQALKHNRQGAQQSPTGHDGPC